MSEIGGPDKVNPLLSRGKLPKASKKKKLSKKSSGNHSPADAQPTKEDVVQDEPDEPEGGVVDLADQLLDQLDQHGIQDKPASTADKIKNGLKDAFHGHGSGSHGSTGDKKVSRQQARKLKRQQEEEAMRQQARQEVEADNDKSIEEERLAIEQGCKKLNVRIKEVEPDGHCMYNAIADQVNSLKLVPHNRPETYGTMRAHAAHYMRQHKDEFLPFLAPEDPNEDVMSDKGFEAYCDAVQNTAEWGGEPEMLALSRHFEAPIHVLQAGTDLVKVGDEFDGKNPPIMISYHRKMYGLGEHYNSLRPASYQPATTGASS